MTAHSPHDPPGEAAPPDDEIEARIREELGNVAGPPGMPDPVAAGLVADLAVEDGTATLSLDLDRLEAPVAERVADQCRGAALSVPGVAGVRIEGVPEHGADEPSIEFPEVDSVVAVGSAKGGVGKTTVAVSLARALDAAGEDVALFDADIYGPNVPELVGVDGPVRATDDGRPAPLSADGIEVMSVGLLASEAPIAWRGAMAHDALTDLLGDAAWDDRDVLVIDLPPGTGDVVLTTLQEVPVDAAVLVTTPFATSVSDTERSARLFAENGVPVVGTVTNMSGFTCEECGTVHDLFEETDESEGEDDAHGGDGDRNADADGVTAIPSLCELPFSREFQDPTAGEDVLERLDPAVRTLREELDDDGPTVPDDALDVRGLPPRTAQQQALIEIERRAGDAVSVVTDGDADALLDAVERTVAGEDRLTIDTADVREIDPARALVRIETET